MGTAAVQPRGLFIMHDMIQSQTPRKRDYVGPLTFAFPSLSSNAEGVHRELLFILTSVSFSFLLLPNESSKT